MSGIYLPVTTTAFAEAIKELPLSTVYAKAGEILNSTTHLRRSNDELRSFIQNDCDSEQDRRELEGYITENEGVMESMMTRIRLLKTEVENRGQIWIEEEHSVEGFGSGSSQGQGHGEPQEGERSGSAAVNGAEGGVSAGPNGTAETGTGNDESRNSNDEGERNGVYL